MHEYRGYTHDHMFHMYRKTKEHLIDFYVMDDFGNAIISNLYFWEYEDNCEERNNNHD